MILYYNQLHELLFKTKSVSKVKLLQAYFNQIAMKVHQSHLIFIQSVKLDYNLPLLSLFFKTSSGGPPLMLCFGLCSHKWEIFVLAESLEQSRILSNTIFFKSQNPQNLGGPMYTLLLRLHIL